MKPKLLTQFAKANQELWLLLSMFIILALINFLVASDRMLLGLYSLPVVFSAYFYGRRHATLTAVAAVFLVTLVALFNLIPPAIYLIAHHGRLIDKHHASGQQIEQLVLSTSHGGEKLPSREYADASGCCGFNGHLFVVAGCSCDFNTLPAETRVNCGKQVFGDGRFSQRK